MIEEIPVANARVPASLAAIAAAVAALTGVLIARAHAGAAWPAAIGATLIVLGVLAGYRGAVAVGVFGLATSAVVLTYDSPLSDSLLVCALVAIACMAIVYAADLSFSVRPTAVPSSVTMWGMLQAYAAVTVAGVVGATVLLSLVLSIEWPVWLLLLPAALLAGTTVLLVNRLIAYNKELTAEVRPAAATSRPTRIPPPPRH